VDGQITAIETQRSRGGRRANVFLNGDYAFSLQGDLDAGLRVGDFLDAAAAADLLRRDGRARAMEAALVFLTSRPRSEREVRDRLARRQFLPSEIDDCVARLKELRYLDDRAFAEFWIEQRQQHRPRGARAIATELFRKGVDREIGREVLIEATEQRDQVELALTAAQGKLRSLRMLEPRDRRQRLSAFLARRGFDWETIRSTLRRIEDS
jgi:regulatory protein